MKLLLFFIDGLGLGADDETNPARFLLDGIADVRLTALTIRSSGAPFRFLEEYHEGRTLFADLTNVFLRERVLDWPLITPEEAAERMARILG